MHFLEVFPCGIIVCNHFWQGYLLMYAILKETAPVWQDPKLALILMEYFLHSGKKNYTAKGRFYIF